MLVAMMYHYIHAEGDDPIYHGLHGLSVSEFEQHLDFLCKNFSHVSHAQLLAYARQEAVLPERGFCLTFDDGFKQHFNNVLPVLLKFGLEGSFYIPTKPVKEKKLHLLEKQRLCQYGIFEDYYEFLQAFYEAAQTHTDEYKLGAVIPNKTNVEAAAYYLAQHNFYSVEERFYRFVRDEVLNAKEFEQTITALFARYFDEDSVCGRYYLNAEEIGKLAKQGMHVGGHSHSHPHLNKLHALAAREEIRLGNSYLQTFTGKVVESFSYPFGSYNADTIMHLQQQNIAYAYTTRNSIYQNGYAPYELTRIDAASFNPEALC